MNRENRILFIENIGFISCIYLFFFARRYKKIFFLNSSEKLIFFGNFLNKFHYSVSAQKLEYTDFPGTHYEVEEEGYQNGVDRVYDRYKENLYTKITLQFCRNDLYELALKKILFNEYTLKRIKFSIFLRKLSEKYSGAPIIIFPTDNEDFISIISSAYRLQIPSHVPRFIKIINSIKEFLKNFFGIFLFPVLLIYPIIKTVARGVKIKDNKTDFSFAFDIYDNGFLRRYHDLIINNSKDFSLNRILYVVRNRFDNGINAKQTQQFFKRYHINYIESDKISVSLEYLFKKVFIDFFINSLIFYLKYFAHSNKNHVLIFPSISLMGMKIKAELFYERYNVNVFIARDEYSPFHIVRTLVAHTYGNKTIGFSHGDDLFHHNGLNYLVFDKFGCWGEYYKTALSKSLKHSNCFLLGAGIYGLDKTHQWVEDGVIPEKYRKIKKNFKIVLIFGTNYGINVGISKESSNNFYTTALKLTDEFQDVFRIIKQKGTEFDDSDYQKIIHGHQRVIIDDSTWSYRLLPIADLVLCDKSTSIGLESIVAGKTVLYYDENSNWVKNNPYRSYSKYLVAHTEQEFERNINRVLKENTYLDDETIKKIQSYHGFCFDGNVAKRFQEVCLELNTEVELIKKGTK